MKRTTLNYMNSPFARFSFFILLAFISSYNIYAQNTQTTVADSLMQRWVVIYNTDDSTAIEQFYADDVSASSDGRPGVTIGKEAVLAGSLRQMARTDNLQIDPLYSYEEGDDAYHIGRFTIEVEEKPTTGAYVFFFKKNPDQQWKLRFAYYIHDPEARLEEFIPSRK